VTECEPSGSQEPLAILRAVALLPSESTIHAAVNAALVVLGAIYAIVTPSIAFLFGEEHAAAGMLFVTAYTVVFCLILWQRHKQRTAVPPTNDFWNWLWQFIGRGAKLKHSSRSRILNRWRPPDFVSFPDARRSTSFARLVDKTWRELVLFRGSAPTLFWANKDARCAARILGRSNNPVLAVSAGLVSLSATRPEVVRVYLLHEFAHIKNNDLEVFAWTLSLLDAFRAIVVLAICGSVALSWPYLHSGLWTALLLMVGVIWLVSLALVWMLLARYAGVIISLRELYADVQAVAWSGDLDEYREIVRRDLHGAPTERAREWWTLLTLRLIHLSPIERLRMLSEPERLIAPRYRHFAAAAVLCAIVQSSPFGIGYGRHWMRIPFLLVWGPLCVAYLWNVVRAIRGMSVVPKANRWSATTSLAITASLMLFLPRVSVPGIYTNLVLSLGDWSGFLLGLRDGISSLALEWRSPSLAFVPLFCWCILWALTHDTPPARAFHSNTPRTPVLAWIVGAICLEAILVALLMWDSSFPVIENTGAWLLEHPAAVPIAPLLVLLLGIFLLTYTRNSGGRPLRT
jgi:Zn-dependent protease with chaperone function